MNKSKQVEDTATMVKESLANSLPKMYHPTEDLVKIPIYTDGAKIVITIEKVDPYTIENTEDKIYTNSKGELKDIN